MGSNVVGFNEAEIDHLMIDILDYTSRIKLIFNKIDDLVNETRNYYGCESANIMRNHFELIKYDFNIIINNLLSYNSDLYNLKNKYKNGMDILSSEIIRSGSNVEDVSKPNRYVERR